VAALLLGDVVLIKGFRGRRRKKSLTITLAHSHGDAGEEARELEHNVLGGGTRPTVTIVRVGQERVIHFLSNQREVLQGVLRDVVDKNMLTNDSHSKVVLDMLVLHKIHRLLLKIDRESRRANEVLALVVDEENRNIRVADEVLNNRNVGDILKLLHKLVRFTL
jgi:hypothetical protein